MSNTYLNKNLEDSDELSMSEEEDTLPPPSKVNIEDAVDEALQEYELQKMRQQAEEASSNNPFDVLKEPITDNEFLRYFTKLPPPMPEFKEPKAFGFKIRNDILDIHKKFVPD